MNEINNIEPEADELTIDRKKYIWTGKKWYTVPEVI